MKSGVLLAGLMMVGLGCGIILGANSVTLEVKTNARGVVHEVIRSWGVVLYERVYNTFYTELIASEDQVPVKQMLVLRANMSQGSAKQFAGFRMLRAIRNFELMCPTLGPEKARKLAGRFLALNLVELEDLIGALGENLEYDKKYYDRAGLMIGIGNSQGAPYDMRVFQQAQTEQDETRRW